MVKYKNKLKNAKEKISENLKQYLRGIVEEKWGVSYQLQRMHVY